MSSWALVFSTTGRVVSLMTADEAPEEAPAGHDYRLVAAGVPAGAGAGRELQVIDGALAWVDVRSLADAKAQAWERIKAAREAAFDAPLVTPHGTFDSDVRARANLTAAVLLAQTLDSMSLPAAIDFTLVDNTVVTLSAAQLTAVGLLLGQKMQAAFATGRALRLVIDACDTVAAADAVSWPPAAT